MLSICGEILILLVEVRLEHFLGHRSCCKTSLNVVLGHNALDEDGYRYLGFVHWGEADKPSDVQLHVVVSPLTRTGLACDGDARDFNAAGRADGGGFAHPLDEGIVMLGLQTDRGSAGVEGS